MTEYPFKTDDLAAELDVAPKTILRWAKQLGIGINLGGRAGYRYSAADRARLVDSLKVEPAQARRKRRRAA